MNGDANNFARWAWLGAACLIALLDAGIKQAVFLLMPYGDSIPLMPFFNLVHAWNTGAAFSLLADAGGWQQYFLSAVGIGISCFLARLLWLGVARRLDAAAYSLILGGALGNVADRLVRGFVVDYLDFYWGGWHWPAFNLADIAITLGVALMIIASFHQPARIGASSSRPKS